jgi:hypothetical protein
MNKFITVVRVESDVQNGQVVGKFTPVVLNVDHVTAILPIEDTFELGIGARSEIRATNLSFSMVAETQEELINKIYG